MERAHRNQNNLLKQLPAATRALLRAVTHRAEQLGAPIYLVGGSVRDLLLNRPNLDLDLVLEGDAIKLGRALSHQFGGRLVAHKAFGTSVWWLPGDQKKIFRALHVPLKGTHRVRLPVFLDLITARRETYRRPAALPTVQFDGIRADQFRRDFTINTLAIRLDGPDASELLDPWGGFQDLQNKLLRTLHPLSFSDDPTRILRILRQAGRLGFKIETETLRQLKMYLPILSQVSGERIRTELELALVESERISILRSMQKLGVLKTIHPKLPISPASVRTLKSREPKSVPSLWNLGDYSVSDLGFILWLMNYPSSSIAGIADRLSFRAELRDAILFAERLRSLKARLHSMPPSQVVPILEKMPLLAVYAFFLANQKTKVGNILKTYAVKLRHIQPHTDGNDLRKLGLKPGSHYKHILNRLRAAWLDGEVRTGQQEQKLLKKLIDEYR